MDNVALIGTVLAEKSIRELQNLYEELQKHDCTKLNSCVNCPCTEMYIGGLNLKDLDTIFACGTVKRLLKQEINKRTVSRKTDKWAISDLLALLDPSVLESQPVCSMLINFKDGTILNLTTPLEGDDERDNA